MILPPRLALHSPVSVSDQFVWALEIEGYGAGCLFFAHQGFAPHEVGAEFLERWGPKRGDYWVRRFNGAETVVSRARFGERYVFDGYGEI